MTTLELVNLIDKDLQDKARLLVRDADTEDLLLLIEWSTMRNTIKARLDLHQGQY